MNVPQTPIRFDDGAAYERLMGVWSRSAGRVFLEFLSPPPEQRWLDVGCGNGAFTDLVMHNCAPSEMHGIDPSEGQLAYARGRLAGRGAVFRQGDAMALPYMDDRFDIAIMALVIHFVPDPVRAVAEMTRVVRPGGTVATYVWAYDEALSPIDPFDAEFASADVAAPTPPSLHAVSLSALSRLWTDAGLEEIETRTIATDRTFVDFDEMWTSVTGTGRLKSAAATMAPATLARIQAGLRDRLHADAEGRITYSALANAIKGRVPRLR
jgi:ubiquinone/menaquinone biosynthesis C-methylase UbiE